MYVKQMGWFKLGPIDTGLLDEQEYMHTCTCHIYWYTCTQCMCTDVQWYHV